HGFAASARGDGGDLAVWDPASVVDAVSRDPSGTYAAAAADVLEAFAADDALTARFALPEFGSGATFPGEIAIGFHFVDYVVHGWDVARTIGTSLELPDDVIAGALPVALAVPDGEFRAAAGAPFQQAVDGAESAAGLDRILLHLGRSPAWQPDPAECR
ncbi:MAG TPA: TIGR03086 family protein, partial [Mycobacterium sp.]